MPHAKTEKVVMASALCKHYEIESKIIRALENINLNISTGDFICLYGPSGA